MILPNIVLNRLNADRLDGLAKWHGTSPDIMAKQIIEEALREIWKTQGRDIEEMQRGLEYFAKL